MNCHHCGQPFKPAQWVYRHQYIRWCTPCNKTHAVSGSVKERCREPRVNDLLSERERLLNQASGPGWEPAGDEDRPFVTHTGRHLLYVRQEGTGKFAYLDLESKLILTKREANFAFGCEAEYPTRSLPSPPQPSYKQRGGRGSYGGGHRPPPGGFSSSFDEEDD